MKSNWIKIKEQKRAHEKRRRNLRNLSEESLEKSREERRRENFNEEHRKAERKRARDETLTTVSFQVMFSFLINMPRCLTYFIKVAKKRRRRPENVCNSVLTDSDLPWPQSAF